jgi:hypothetical protein
VVILVAINLLYFLVASAYVLGGADGQFSSKISAHTHSHGRKISRAFAPRQLFQQLCHALLPGIRTPGAVQPVVDGEQALAFEGRVESVGSGVVLERRQKVFGHGHGGAAGVGAGPAPIAARGRYLNYLRQAGGLHAPLLYEPLGMLHVFLRPVGARAAWRQALQKRGVVQGVAQSVDPAPANSDHHADVPSHAGLAGGLFEDAHPKLSLAGVVHPQPRVELLRRFKREVCLITHELIAACGYFTGVRVPFDR